MKREQDDDRSQSKNRKPYRNAVKGFVIGIVVGVVLICLRPWNFIREISGQSGSSYTTAAGTTVIEYQEEDNAKAAVTISYLQKLIEPASDLVTVKYFYKDADTYTNTKQFFDHAVPFTTNEVVFTYTGIVSLGIDVSQCGFSVDNENKRIEISLPDVKIIANEIDADSFEFITTKDSVFNRTSMEDYTSLLAKLKEEKATETMNDQDLLDEVEKRAETVISNFIHETDLAADYSIDYK